MKKRPSKAKIQKAVEYFTGLLDTLGGKPEVNEACVTAIYALETQQDLNQIPAVRLEEIVKAEKSGRCLILPAKPNKDCYVVFYTNNRVQPITVSEYKWCKLNDDWVVVASDGKSYFLANAFSTRDEAEEALAKHKG